MKRDSAIHFVNVFAIFVIVTLVVPSCAMKNDIAELRRDILVQNEIAESRLSSLEQAVGIIDSLTREQYSLSKGLRALLGTQNIEQQDNIEMIAARQDEINYQLRELLQNLQAIQLYGGIETKPADNISSSAASSNPAPVPANNAPRTPVAPQNNSSKVDPNELYNAALEDIRNERYQLAESRFLSFLMQFPKNELAGNAQYWLGESVYGQGKYDLAISEFDKVLKKYKKSPKVPAAMLKIGFAQLEKGERKTATATLNKLIKSYPKSGEADLARERLNTP